MKRLCNILVLFAIMLCPIISFAFNLSVIKTNESCPGNGSLHFLITNAIPGGSIVYVVYKLPDTTTPYASGPADTVNGLTTGSYRVIARETLGSVSTTQQQDVIITSSFIPLSYTVEVVNQACSVISVISVIVSEGTAATYEIISGPLTFPVQTSNTFSGLVTGVYRMKVIDSCGNAAVQAFTVSLNPAVLTTINPDFTPTTPPSCNFVVANNTIAAGTGTVIAYPIQIHYILHLPTGDTHINTVLNSGDQYSQNISQIIPYFPTQNYIYDVILTDACGITHPLNNFIVNDDIQLSQTIHTLPCNKFYFTLNASNYTGNYTIQFTLAPAGFNPASFNSSYPGPYSSSNVDFGNDSNFVPFGDYSVTITDDCGRTGTTDFSIEDNPPVPNVIEIGYGCLSTDGILIASIANYKIVTAIITAAPSSYPFPIPHDVSAFIDMAGALRLEPVPLGDYTFRLIDDCGNIYDPVTVSAPPIVNLGLEITSLVGCDIGRASIKMKSKNALLTSVKITAAPAGFAFSLPYDISNQIISSGELYMADLPPGNYTFSSVDECFTSNPSIQIDGYQITSSTFSLIPDCGIFSIPLDFIDNVTESETFWLQKLLDPTTDTWGNPATETVYVDGTVPNGSNSIMIQNNITNTNFTFNGVFRIVHHFASYNNGRDINSGLVASANKDCIEILSPYLTFTNALAINDVYRIPCSSTGNFDVLLDTTGPDPLHYSIVERDGNSFIVDNGTSNVFLNLMPGIYQFEVADNCGNTINRTFDVSELNSLVTIYPICNMVTCVASITGNETFDLSAQSPIILGHQSTTEYTLSYHTSQADADNNVNPITNLTNFNPATNPQTIYIRLIFNQFPNCYQTGTFDLISGQKPQIDLASSYELCDGQPVLLDASPGNLPITSYLWSNGITTPAITISDIGTTIVSVTATNAYGSCNAVSFNCISSKEITVTIPDIPHIDHIDTHDWTDIENSITVITDHEGAFEYSINGISFQNSPVFDHLRPGLYTVYVRDLNGCITVTQEVWLLNYPKFFTPNGDGYNETWFVKNSENEPDFKVYIFDRYGKLITAVTPNTPGWDGKLNGRLLFADDYWFMAYRQDGRILRGHFTLLR